MDKYLLIGANIFTVVLLVFSSFINVVGVQSITLSSVKESPLFGIRTKRAINEASKDLLVSDYLGKTNTITLLIPPQSNRMELFRIAISRIQTMDDGSFERFVKSAVAQLSKQEKLTDITPRHLITGLYQIRDNPQAFMDYTGSNNGNITWRYTPTLCWFPGCLIMGVLITVLIYLAILLLIILVPTIAPGCGGFAVDICQMPNK